MKTVTIKPTSDEKNRTPDIRSAINTLNNGGTISFENGEYHFYEEGCLCDRFAPSNNETGLKRVAFPLINCSDITIDCDNSTFVFHGRVFPFIIQNSKNITIKNGTFTTYLPPYALMTVTEKSESGFSCLIDNEKSPYEVSNGNLVFKRDGFDISTAEKKLSLHSLDRGIIRYLFAGESTDFKNGLAAPYIDCDAESHGSELFFRYRENKNSERCVYNVGEKISINLEESRSRDIFFIERSKNIKLSVITVIRGAGMGVIAQLSRNIEIERFAAMSSFDEPVTLTADIFHFINCSGEVSIHDCKLSSSLDDACNIHGTYTSVLSVGENYIDVRYGHHEQKFLDLYKKGDVLTVIDNKSLDIIGKFKVLSSEFTDSDGIVQRIYCSDNLPCGIRESFFIESALRMPEIHIHGNICENVPHWRISGGGKILIENNTFNDCDTPLYCYDLAEYWFESGRMTNVTIRNNTFAKARFDSGFIMTGVSGFSKEDTPEIHGKISIYGNTFVNAKKHLMQIYGFKKISVNDNIYKD